MRVLVAFLTMLVLATGAGAQSAPAKGSAAVVYRGVVDEQGEDFVLTKAGTFEAVAVLHSPNFDKQIFARFVGHPVEAKGTMVTRGGKKVLEVQGINDIKRTAEPGDTKK